MKQVIIACLMLFFPLNTCIGGEEPTDIGEASRFHLETCVNEVLEIIQNDALGADPVKQEKILYDKSFEIFDFNTFSMLALGRKYRAFSKPQRQEFIFYFSKMISNTYFPRLAGQDVSDIKIHYMDVRALKAKGDLLRTDISTELVQGETIVDIVYRMIQKSGQEWKIYDIKIEGVSMAANYREQFKQQVSQTPDEIIAQLKEKVEK